MLGSGHLLHAWEEVTWGCTAWDLFAPISNNYQEILAIFADLAASLEAGASATSSNLPEAPFAWPGREQLAEMPPELEGTDGKQAEADNVQVQKIRPQRSQAGALEQNGIGDGEVVFERRNISKVAQ
jgi:hypothetical protein